MSSRPTGQATRHTARVYDRIRRVSRFSRQASHARAACAGSTSSILVLALTVGGGRGLDDAEVLLLAAIVGVLTFLTWVWTDRTSQLGIARRADERLGLGGGLLAAFENARRPERPMAELGARRALGRATFARLRAAAVPPFEIFLVLPLLGGVALFRAIEERDEGRPNGAALVAQVGALAQDLRLSMEAHGGELSAAMEAELTASVQAAFHQAQNSKAEEMGDVMRDVASALDEAADSLPQGSALAEELERLAFEAEAAAVDTDVQEDGPGAEAGTDPQGGNSDPVGPQGERLGELGEVSPRESSNAPEGDSQLADPASSDPFAAGNRSPSVPPGVEPDGGTSAGPSGESRGGTPTEGNSGPANQGANGSTSPDGGSGGEAAIPRGPARAQPGVDGEGAEALDPSSGAPAPWWPDRDDDLVRTWLARTR